MKHETGAIPPKFQVSGRVQNQLKQTNKQSYKTL